MTGPRILALRSAVVSLPLERPVVTPVNRIESVDCVLVTLVAEGGIEGIGYLWVMGRTRARVLELMVQDLKPVVLGAEALEREALALRLHRDTAFLGRTGIAMMAVSAIETALWDIAGKVAGMPLWQLLGGTSRPLPVYAGGLFLSDPLDAILGEARRYVAEGFRAIKMRVGLPRAQDDIARVEAVRAAIGPDVLLMVDAVQAWRVPAAIAIGHQLERFDLTWIEDPVAFDDLAGMAAVAAALDVPVAAGENDFGAAGFKRLMDARAADLVMIDLQRAGGIGGWHRIAADAGARALPVAPHVFHEISSHLVASTPHAGWLEYVPWWDRLFVEPPRIEAGMMTPPAGPGLGLAFDWDGLEGWRLS